MFLGEQVDDEATPRDALEFDRQRIAPPGRELAERAEVGPHLQAVVGHGIVAAHEPEQSGHHNDLPVCSRGQRGRIEVVPDDTGVAPPRWECRRADEGTVRRLGAEQVLASHAEQLLVAAAHGEERVNDRGSTVAESSAERTGLRCPWGTSPASAFRLALRGRQQQHWNIVRKSRPPAGHRPTLASRVQNMRVHLDAEKCQGHNRCYALAPELFDVDDYGQAMLLVEGDVPEELQDKARLAASNCPEYAITITENG